VTLSDYNLIIENERVIARALAAINIHKDELEAMLYTYRQLAIKKFMDTNGFVEPRRKQ